MVAQARPGHWFLFDFGMVISLAPESEDWRALEEVAGVELESQTSGYWRHRREYDAGRLDPVQYWSRALGRPVSGGSANQLDALDARQWSHCNLDTLDVLEELEGSGAGLALLSNMPAPMAATFSSSSPWVRYFSRLFFSGQLGLLKPDPAIFQHVLGELNADPGTVTFIDDVAENVEAADRLGLRTVHFSAGIDLETALGLRTVPDRDGDGLERIA
ncbi:MAG: haloacid dehalogenase [Micrococcaceae bacterium]|nr:haloacid dehalogenase [Micrococcaceae bacterium]